MILRINENDIDFTIENEKTAYDIGLAVEKALGEESRIISSIEVDGAYYGLEDEELKEIDIATIDVMNIEALTKSELISALLQESKNILVNIIEDLKKNGFGNVGKYHDLFQWIIETIKVVNENAVFDLVETKLTISTIQQLSDYLSGHELKEEKLDGVVSILENLIKYLEAIDLKISADYHIEKEDLKSAIDGALVILPEISGDFQVGHDKEALQKINGIISVLEMCCLYIKMNLTTYNEGEREGINELYIEINSLLGEVVEAFENGDMVLIGDLMEYELPEKLEHYKEILFLS